MFSDSPRKSYNFYKDPNIAEVLHCTEVLKRIELRVNAELENFPEHAGLLDVRYMAPLISFDLIALHILHRLTES